MYWDTVSLLVLTLFTGVATEAGNTHAGEAVLFVNTAHGVVHVAHVLTLLIVALVDICQPQTAL